MQGMVGGLTCKNRPWPTCIARRRLARQTRADRIALIRRRLNGFELRHAAREERRRGRRPRVERETRQMSLLDSAGEWHERRYDGTARRAPHVRRREAALELVPEGSAVHGPAIFEAGWTECLYRLDIREFPEWTVAIVREFEMENFAWSVFPRADKLAAAICRGSMSIRRG